MYVHLHNKCLQSALPVLFSVADVLNMRTQGLIHINLTLHYNSEQYMNSNRINLCGSIIIYVYMWSCPDQERVGNIEGKKKTMRKTGCRCISFDTISPQMV